MNKLGKIKVKQHLPYTQKSNVIWFSHEHQSLIERLWAPYINILASNQFLSDMVLYILADQKRLEKYMEDFNKRHEKQIIEKNVQIPTVKVIEKITLTKCPYCWKEFKGLKALGEHLPQCEVFKQEKEKNSNT